MGVSVLCRALVALAPALAAAGAPQRPHVLHIVADDLGYDDLGHFNGGKTHTPAIDALIGGGIALSAYNTFKICSPTRASIMTGRYPWGAGFYDMSQDENHCAANFTMLPQLMRGAGYATHAIGKWVRRSPRVPHALRCAADGSPCERRCCGPLSRRSFRTRMWDSSRSGAHRHTMGLTRSLATMRRASPITGPTRRRWRIICVVRTGRTCRSTMGSTLALRLRA